MQRNAVVVVADKTSLKRPFIFACAVNMVGLVSNASVVILYILEIACLLLSVLGVFGACTGRRWCLILFAAGMAAASQTIIVKTALSYQDIYEVDDTLDPREESKLLSMMPLSATGKFKCCGLIEGYKDWGTAIPASCHCQSPGKCVSIPLRYMQYNIVCTVQHAGLQNKINLELRCIYSVECSACLPIYVSALKRAFSLAMGIKFGSGVFWVGPAPTPPLHCITIQALVYNFFFFFSGGSAGDELKADGADEAQTGIHGPAAVQPLRPRCLLVITE
uniref:Tetraspanin n=1 Tax=Hippocampus comes TaxID=109280 RepID=A0A3Q2YSP0_HIPCM